VGIRSVARVARELGVHSRLNTVPSLALGTSEVTLMEITAAFAAIANGGVAVAPTTLEPDSAAPALIPTRRLPDPVRAVSPESAFLVTYLLRGVMQQGTGAASARWGLSGVTAGKTGTTDDLRDAWFVGYTPDLAVGVWVGMDDGHAVGLTGSQAALPIWASVMQAAVRRVPPRPFTVPQGIVLAPVEARTGRGVSAMCGGGPAITEAFRAGTEPKATCDVPVAVEAATGRIVDWVRGLFR
jgi:membrane carboxypeptidase/penicillin-binding protein